MVQTIEQFFTEQCACFARNDFSRMSRRFALPTAIYFGERILIVKTHKAIETLLSLKRKTLDQANYASTGFRIIAQSINARKHLSAWVEFRHFDAQDNLITTSTSRYFCARHIGTDLLVQLIEYLHPPQLGFAAETAPRLVESDYHSICAPA